LFNQNNTRYVPAESVYAVFEVKQSLNLTHLRYAAEKARSVRRLYRTSAVIPHAGGKYEPKQPPRILAGILCLENEWKSSLEEHFRAELKKFGPEGLIDLGCVLKGGSFEYRIDNDRFKSAPTDSELICFFLTLLERLQACGTVAAVDFRQYSRALENGRHGDLTRFLKPSPSSKRLKN
jgi:hypothetical protein